MSRVMIFSERQPLASPIERQLWIKRLPLGYPAYMVKWQLYTTISSSRHLSSPSPRGGGLKFKASAGQLQSYIRLQL
jgi:hypothetical protein